MIRLAIHLSKVRALQDARKRRIAHYFSKDAQNEFIQICAQKVMNVTVDYVKSSKYFGIICDATPDAAHTKQTTVLVRYFKFADRVYTIVEWFLHFVDCNKMGEDIRNAEARWSQFW